MQPERQRGLVFVLSGPAGAGKTALVSALRERKPDLYYCITATTRPPRPGERHGVDYFFYSEPEFLDLQTAGGLLEYARVPPGGPWLYGMPAAQVVEALQRGQDVIAGVSGIDVQGAASVRQRIPNAILIFLKPPDFDTLERRLRQRGTESAEDMERRLQNARTELAREPEFDYTVINPDGGLELAVDEVVSIMQRERSRPSPRYAEVTHVGTR